MGAENALYDPQTGSLHLLNDTALAIWHLCDGSTEPGEMVIAICEVSGLHPDIVAEDVRRILGEFDEVGLLTWTV
jgi:PqqD family protein of HPr-rel-A system